MGSITEPLGWMFCEPYGRDLGGYTGRVSVVATANTPQGTATSTYYRSLGPDVGVFGVVTNATRGSVTLSSPSGRSAPVTVPVVDGSFAAPSLTSCRGTLRARFRGEGLHERRTFTKAASPYDLVLTPARNR